MTKGPNPTMLRVHIHITFIYQVEGPKSIDQDTTSSYHVFNNIEVPCRDNNSTTKDAILLHFVVLHHHISSIGESS